MPHWLLRKHSHILTLIILLIAFQAVYGLGFFLWVVFFDPSFITQSSLEQILFWMLPLLLLPFVVVWGLWMRKAWAYWMMLLLELALFALSVASFGSFLLSTLPGQHGYNENRGSILYAIPALVILVFCFVKQEPLRREMHATG